MSLDIDYPLEIIVGVVFRSRWGWYVSEKEDWFLDLRKFARAFGEDGDDPEVGAERFGIAVLDGESAARFLPFIEDRRGEKAELSDALLGRMPAASWDDVIEVSPSLLVDFDRRTLKSMFGEPASFEDFVPDGWAGERAPFLEEVPEEQRYWVIDGRDYFEPLLG